MKRINLVIFVTMILFGLAGFALAQTFPPIVPCTDNCKTQEFFTLVNNLVRYFVFILAVPVATVAIAYAGILMATSPKDPSKHKEAIDILKAAVWGLVLVLSAWLIVTTIFNYVVKSDFQTTNSNYISPN